ncbi:MAG: hypothetical protein ABI193_16445 [Minicystis sp.]
MRGRLLFVVALLVLGIGGSSVGCGENTVVGGRNCTLEEAAKYGCASCPVTCKLLDGGVGIADAAEAGVTCDGQCVPLPAPSWSGPLLLWMGPESEAPACPEQAKSSQTWYGDLVVLPASCGVCACEPPVGACTLPTELTASSSICADQPGTHATFFNAPPGWDGSCTSNNKIKDGEVCGDPSAPSLCVASLTIAPINMTTGTCKPALVVPPEPLVKPTWGISGQSCQGTPSTGAAGCGDSSALCVPAVAPGFAQCIYKEGDVACAVNPLTLYTERHVLYDGYTDSRGCAPCTCGEPQGSSCSDLLSVFSDPACAGLVGTYSISSLGPACFDIQPPGQALGSKSAGPITFNPGVCQPGGGGPTGAAEPLHPTTFCCMPTP